MQLTGNKAYMAVEKLAQRLFFATPFQSPDVPVRFVLISMRTSIRNNLHYATKPSLKFLSSSSSINNLPLSLHRIAGNKASSIN